MKRKLIAMGLILMMLILQGCSTQEKSINDTKFVIGTIVSIQLNGTDDQAIIDGSFAILEGVDQWMSLTITDSLINDLNNQAGQGPYPVSEDAFYVIEKALAYSELSGGLFDVSMEPVIDLWGIGTEGAQVPNDQLLAEKLELVGYEKIQLDKEALTVELPEGMSIDLGGIGKGYAADKIVEYLETEGVTSAIINLGGNIVALGSKADEQPFRVGVQNPFDSRNDYFGVVEVMDKTVVTSGIYERNFEEDGTLYHHILNPEDGYPMDNGVAGVTVITSKSIDADGLSTVLFLLGVEEGLALVNSLDGVECIFVDENRQVYLSDNVGDIFELSDDSFQLME